MAAHQLEAARLGEDEPPPIEADETETSGQAVSWRGALASGIACSFGCRMFWQPRD